MSPMVSGCLARGVVRAATVLLVALLPASLPAAAPGPSGPAAPAEGREKCPVCGMFVTMFPDWVCSIEFKDGTKALTDGPKDMFKFYHDMARYDRARKQADVSRVLVTDYYGLSLIDGRQARYVVGSDVFGPMGRELVPFAEEAGAKEFLRDHKGKKIVGFKDVDQAFLKAMEQ